LHLSFHIPPNFVSGGKIRFVRELIMEISGVRMDFTGDFNSLGMNNPNGWSQAVGKKRGDVDEHPDQAQYLNTEEINRVQEALSGVRGDSSYGSTVLSNFSSKEKGSFDMSGAGSRSSGEDPGGYDRIYTNNIANASPTTPALHPADMSAQDRLATRPQFDTGTLTNPNTLGDTLTGLLENVHAKTLSYESQSDALNQKNAGSPMDMAKQELMPQNEMLTGIKPTEDEKTDIERSIENYIEVMNGSYEYYIYSSLTVDTGKSVAQTAQTLTKG
jgi:hypothetical protein